MKIRTKLTLQYTGGTALVFSIIVFTIYIFSEHSRESEFYRNLEQEALTKVNLIFNNAIGTETIQSIYQNNRQFIDEVEVAVYTTDFQLVYHDAQDIDIIKETPSLILDAIEYNTLQFYEGNYQAIMMLYTYQGIDYIVTAAAYDGYGYKKIASQTQLLLILWSCGLCVLTILGYILARSALHPVSDIVKKVDAINESNLETRLVIKKEHDELDELSETFNRLLDRLEQSFNDQKMLVNNISLELKTPLTTLIAELEVGLLPEKQNSNDYKNIISQALSDTKKMENLIQGVLDLAKINYNIQQFTTEDIRIDKLLLDVRDVVLKTNPSYSVNLIYDKKIVDSTRATVNGNEYLLKIAFINLIENNCKFSVNKTSVIQISYSKQNTIIRFSDTGIGISRDEIDKIFTPFYRGKNSSNTDGLGIGMTLTQKVINLHKGTISILSKIGEGTTFIIEIPHI